MTIAQAFIQGDIYEACERALELHESREDALASVTAWLISWYGRGTRHARLAVEEAREYMEGSDEMSLL